MKPRGSTRVECESPWSHYLGQPCLVFATRSHCCHGSVPQYVNISTCEGFIMQSFGERSPATLSALRSWTECGVNMSTARVIMQCEL